MSITATFSEVVASENPAELNKLLDAVGATDDNPAYLFITLQSEGMVRDYVVGVDRGLSPYAALPAACVTRRAQASASR
jgi:hypothetical protein